MQNFSIDILIDKRVLLVYAKNVFYLKGRDIYSGHSPPPGGGIIVYIENREEFEGGHEKRKGKGGIDKKNTLKYLYEV